MDRTHVTDVHEALSPHANRIAIGDDLLAVLRRIPGTSPLDVMNVRMILEPQAAELAATQATIAWYEPSSSTRAGRMPCSRYHFSM